MVRLRIALGVASSLVAVAALTIVFAGTGQAQGNGNGLPNGPNVVVTNTPLPVTGDLNAVVSGNVSATIINPANNPVLIRDVDAQGAKELWQKNAAQMIQSAFQVIVDFPDVPLGKALVIEHANVLYETVPSSADPDLLSITSMGQGGVATNGHAQYFPLQLYRGRFFADVVTKFYVPAGEHLRVRVDRNDELGFAQMTVIATGYLVDYP